MSAQDSAAGLPTSTLASELAISVPHILHTSHGSSFCVNLLTGSCHPVGLWELAVLDHFRLLIPESVGLTELYSTWAKARLEQSLLRRLMPDRLVRRIQLQLSADDRSLFGSRYSRTLPGHEEALQELKRKRLILSERDIKKMLGHTMSVSDEKVAIDLVCVPTANRPEQLKRCLKSVADVLSRKRAYCSIVVVDDSSCPSAEAMTNAVIEQQLVNSSVRIEHFTASKRLQVVESVAASTGVDKAVLEFALCPPALTITTGAARNVMLLLSAGRYSVHTDDDTILEARLPSSAVNRIGVGEARECYELSFYNSRVENESKHPLYVTEDVIDIHEKFLGRSFAALYRDEPKIDLKNCDPVTLKALLTTKARVSLTTMGICGDAGMGTNAGLIASVGISTLKEMAPSSTGGNTMFLTREIFRCANRPVLHRSVEFQSMSFGLDGTRLLPPFPPLGRNQDSVFGLLNQLANEESLVCRLPVAVSHVPNKRREFVSRSAAESILLLNDVLLLVLSSCRTDLCENTRQVYESLGAQRECISSMSRPSFKALLLVLVASKKLGRRNGLLELLNRYGGTSRAWDDEMRALAEETAQSLIGHTNFIPLEFSDAPEDEALDRTKWYISMFGRLLSVWPMVVNAAKGLC